MPERPRIVKVVIPAAGFGTRMLPATKVIPKEMLPVAGMPLIQYAVEEAAASGIETAILVVRNHKSPIPAHFTRDPSLESYLQKRHLTDATEVVRRLAQLVDLRFVEQETLLGLGHAISRAHFLGLSLRRRFKLHLSPRRQPGLFLFHRIHLPVSLNPSECFHREQSSAIRSSRVLTYSLNATDSTGKRFTGTSVYDKQ
jgi:Nucleotidyl transferase